MDTGVQRRILITGGASGIGQATALLAAQRGYAVAINFAHSDRAARDLVSQIEAMGQVAVAIKADIAEEEEVVRMFETMDPGRSSLSHIRRYISSNDCPLPLRQWKLGIDPVVRIGKIVAFVGPVRTRKKMLKADASDKHNECLFVGN
jgi:NAD(P)-dependent dehydrogenase (short-subunit alcohol dehydrogenase family)